MAFDVTDPKTCCSRRAQVATPEDPASARLGETVYQFLPRSLGGNLVDGYRAEARRLRTKGLPLLSRHNRCAPACVRWQPQLSRAPGSRGAVGSLRGLTIPLSQQKSPPFSCMTCLSRHQLSNRAREH